MRFWELMRLAVDGAARATTRTVLTTCGISIACGALVCMVAFVLGLQHQFEESFQQLGLFNSIEVRPPGAWSDSDDEPDNKPDEQQDDEGPRKPPPPLDDEMLERFEQIAGVDYAYPEFRMSEIQLKRGERSKESFAMGLPRDTAVLGMLGDMLIAGEYFSYSKEAEILLGEGNLSELGFKKPADAIGETIELTAAGLAAKDKTQFELQRKTVRFRVTGVFRPPSLAASFGADAVLLPIDQMRQLPGSSIERNLRRLRSVEGADLTGFSRVVVHAKSPGDVPAIEKEIRKLGFKSRAFVTRVKEARRFFLYMKLLLGAIGTVGLVVAGLGILNTQLMSVMERVQEIGILKAIGATSGDVRMIFLTESAALGVIGGLGGLGLAWLVSWILQIVFDRIGAAEGVEGSIAAFHYPIWLLVGGVAYAVLVSILSGLYPANRAAAVDPIRALREG